MHAFRTSKSPRPLSFSLARLSSSVAVAAALSVAVSDTAKAAVQTWNPAGGGATSIWDTTSLNWGSGTLWGSGSALFNATGTAFNTIGVVGGVTASGLQFDVSGYSIGGLGTITLSAPLITVTSVSDLATLSTTVAGTSGVTLGGAGTLLLSGNNTFSGGVTISGGTLKLGSAGALNSATPNALSLSAGKVQLFDNNTTIAGLSGTGGVIENGGVANAALTINSATTGSYSGVLGNGTGTLSVIKTGAGTQTLSGVNTYSGGTTISGGTLAASVVGGSATVTATGVTTAASTNALGSGAVALSGGVLQLNPVATTNTNGLSGRIFSGAPTNNDSTNVNFSGTATSTRYDANLNRADLTTASGGGTAISPIASLAVQWTGKLQITNAGGYRFFTASDDGSRVFIDGVLAVNNDGSKGTTDLGSAVVALSSGLHDIRVDYTQGTGGAVEFLSWAGATAGLDAPVLETAIPSASLFTAEANTTAGASNAVIVGSGAGDALSVTTNSTVNLNGTAFTQAQMGALTQTAGTTLSVTGLAGKTLRFGGAINLGNGVAGTVTLDTLPNVALDGVLSDGGNAMILAKTGAGRVIFGQTSVANALGSTSLIDVQSGTAVLLGAAGGNNPIGAAGLQLSGGNLVLDTKVGGATYDNAISITQNATIQDIVAGVGPIATTLGSAINGISIASGKTLTFDPITGGTNTAGIPSNSTEGGAQITVAGAITGAGNVNAMSTSFGNTVVPGVVLLNSANNSFAGTFTLNGTVFNGNTAIPVNGPTVRVGVANALPSGVTNQIFVKSGTLDFNNTSYTPNAANVLTLGGGPTFTTSTIGSGTGTLTLSNDLVYDATNNGGLGTVSGKLDLNTATLRTINVGDSSSAAIDLIVNSLVSATGGGGFVKTGAGTMALQAGTAAQTSGFAGTVEVAAGTLIVGGGANAFAGDKAIPGAGLIQIDSGATYKAGASNIVENTRAVSVNGTLDMSGFSETIGSIAGTGLITANLPGGFLSVDLLGNNASPFTGAVTGQIALAFGGRLTTAPVTITTNQFSALSHNGNTTLGDIAAPNIITLQLSSSNALPSGFNKGDLIITGGTTGAGHGTLDLAGFNQTVNALTGAAGTAGTQNPVITNSGATDSTLTIGAGNTGGTFAGVIQDGATNKIHVVKTGLGSEILSGPSLYTGTTTINNGKLGVGNATALGSAATGTTVNAGGYLDVVNVSIAEPLTLSGRGQPITTVTLFTNGGPSGPVYTGALSGSGGLLGTVSGAVTLGSNVSVGVVKGSALTISGIIGDGGSAFGLTKTQGDGTLGATPTTLGAGGTLVLTGANTYTGTTTIEAGELRLANASGQAISSTLVNIGNGSNAASLTLGASNQLPSSAIIGFTNGALNAKFQLNGFNQTVAGFNSTGGLPIIQNFETAGTGTGTLTVNNPADTVYNGLIRNSTGTLALTKAGAGTFTITGNGVFGTANIAYTGATLITAGKLVFEDTTSTFTTPITLSASGALEFRENFGRTAIYSGVLNDGGLGFTKTGLGNVVINAVGAVTGTVNVNAGTLNLTDATGNVNPLPGAPINVAAGAQLGFYGVTVVTTTFNNNITLNGLTPGGALVGATVSGTPTNTLSGTLTLAATSNISTGWSDKTLNVSGKITGAGGLVVDKLLYTQNPPIINIQSTTNDYSGGTTINSGTVTFTAGALPAAGNLKFGGTFGNGGNFGVGQLVLSATAGTSFTRSVGTGAGQVQFTGDGGGFSAIGVATTVTFGNAGAIDWSGNGTTGLDANSSLVFNSGTGANNEVNLTNDLNLNGGMRRLAVLANQARLSGSLSGTGGLILDGGATLFMSGATANTYTGRTDLLNQTLNLNKPGQISIPGDIHVGQLVGNGIIALQTGEQIADTAVVSFTGINAANGWLRLNGFTETVAGISDRSGGGVIENVTGTAGVLIVNNSSDFFYNGFFRNGTAGTLALTKNGTGTLTISAGQQSGTANQSYTGATTINDGTLKLANTESFNSAITLNTGTANVEFTPNINRTHTYGPAINGTGNVIKSGLGTLVLSGGASGYSGTTTVNAGTLQITSTQGAGQTGTYTVNPTGTLLIGNGTTGGVLSNNNNITVNAGGLVAFSRNNASTYGGIISGLGNVENRAAGVTTFSGANTYSGSTTANAGTLNLAGTNASAGGLIANSGGTINLDFTQIGSNASGIVAATAPVTLTGGTLAFNVGASAIATQTLGTVLVGAGADSINPTIGAGGTLTLSTGAFSRTAGGLLNFNIPTGLTASVPAGAGVGGILGGYATSNAGTTWLGVSAGGLLSPLTTFSTDLWDGTNVDATAFSTQGASAIANSLRFNTAGAVILSLDGASTSTLTSGGMLVTSAVGANNSSLLGGTLRAAAGTDFVVTQNNASGTFTIGSVLTNNGAPTGLTKGGAGTLIVSGANTYSGPTYLTQGTLINTGSLGSGLTTISAGTTLQIGDGLTNGVIPNLAPNRGFFTVANATAQSYGVPYNADSSFNFLANSANNPASLQLGVFTKTGPGVLTLTGPVLTNTFHQRGGTTVLDTGSNVVVNGFNSVGQVGGDIATLTVKGVGRITETGDFNVGDVAGTVGTLNLQDQGVVTAANFFVGKSVNAVGIVTQTNGTLQRSGGTVDWRIGGSGGTGDAGAYGSYSLSGGNFSTSVNFQVGAYGIGIFNQTGGTASATGGFPDIGRYLGSNGELNVTGGTWSDTALTTSLIIGEEGRGILNVGGNGIVSLVTTSGGGVTGLRLGHIATGAGIANLATGGTLLTTGISRGAGSGIFNFNGGVLRANTGVLSATFMTGLDSANVFSGGAIIDTNALAATIAQSLLAPAGSGVTSIPLTTGGSGYLGEPVVQITGGGGTGATARAIVSGGVVTGFTITSPGINYTSTPTVSILGGGGSGATAGTVTPAANVTTGGLTKLNAGVLTLTGTSTYGGATTISGGSINEAFSTTTGVGSTNLLPANGLVINGGGLTLTGFAAGTNTQTFSGTTISNPGTIVSTIGAGGTMTATLGALTPTAGGAVDFSGTGTINTLTANTNAILGGWATFGGGANWASSAGTGAVAGNISALASYTANTWAAGNNTDMTTAGTVTSLTTNSVRFNSTTPVTVTISGTDTISSGGILITPSATAAATLFTGGTLNSSGASADLIFNHFGTGAATVVSTIGAGTGGLVKSGPGALVLSAPTATPNLYTGATTIGAGTLRIGVTEQIPNTSNVTIDAGATLDLNNLTETINGLTGFGTVSSGIAGTGAVLTVGSGGASSTFSGVIANGTGTNTSLNKTGAGTLTLNNLVAGSYTGGTTISAGAIAIAAPAALSNATQVNVNVLNGLRFDTTIPTISGLAGNSNFALQTQATSAQPNAPVQLSVGNNNASATFTGSGTIVKIGTGFEILAGANTNTGGLIVNAGVLNLSGNNSGASGPLIANNGGILQFNTVNSFYGATGKNVLLTNGGAISFGVVTSNAASVGFGPITAGLSRIDPGSTGALALISEGTQQATISENLDFSAPGLNLTLGAALTGLLGTGNAPVVYTGIITPNANTFRLGGGGGRIILPNNATLAGANNLVVNGAGASGNVFLTGAYGFTGATTINGGAAILTNVANGGTASALGAASTAASNLILNGGTLQFVGTTASTDRLFTLAAAPSALDASGVGPVSFTNTGALGFLNAGNRTFTLQGNNTGLNTLNASIADSFNIAANNGTLANGITSLAKNGNGTWVLGGTNTFTGGITVNNGVLEFASPASMGGTSVAGLANVFVGGGGAVAFAPSFGSVQAGLMRLSPTRADGQAVVNGTAALTTDSSENLNFDGGAAGAALPQITLGAYGNVSYTGTLTPFGGTYRLGGGGGVLSLPNGGLTGARVTVIGGGGPGANFVNNPNLNGAVVLGGSSDYSGGTIITTGSILSATNVAALGSGPLKFQGGFYRVGSDATDITLAADGTSAREIRIGTDASANAATANVEVAGGVNATFNKAFGPAVTLGSNQGQMAFTKWGAGALTLTGGLNLGTSTGTNTVATNSGTLTIERGSFTLASNPTFFNGLIQVGSNNGGTGTLKLGGNNVFANSFQYGSASIVDTYSGSKIDLAGFSDTLRQVRGMGTIVNTGASSANLSIGSNNDVSIFGGNLAGNFTVTKVGTVFNVFGSGSNSNSLELWNNNNPAFTGKFVVNAGGLRIRADGTLGAPTEAFAADKITLNNNAVLFASGNAPLVIGANHGITLGSGGGMIWQFGSAPLIINSPITGSGMLTIGNDLGATYLASDSNNYSGGTTINGNTGAGGNNQLVIGAGGTTGSLPAGDVFFNSNGGNSARLYFFKSSDMTLPNNFNGGGTFLQAGAGTTTLTGTSNVNNTTFVGGGRLKADFSAGNAPIFTGTGLSINGGAFEYLAPAGDNTLRLGTVSLGAFTGPSFGFSGSDIGDSVVQSTYGGSGTQNLIFGGNGRANTGSTLNFVTSGGVNGVTNNIRFTSGPALNNVIGAAFFYNGSDFAAYDINGFVRATNYGSDANTVAPNTLASGKFSLLTTALLNQNGQATAGINFSGGAAALNIAPNQILVLNGNPATLLKSGGGTSVLSGGTASSVNNNAQEWIVRTDSAADTLQIDIPVTGTGTLTKAGAGKLVLTAVNTYTGTSFIDSGTVQVTGNGVLGTGTAGANVRIANAAGATATLTIDSATASIVAGLNTNGDALRVGEGGNGILNQSAGTVTANQYLTLGENLGSAGTYNMSGGTLNVKNNNSNSAQLIVARAGVGNLNISGGATINVLNGAQIQVGSGVVNPGNFQGLVPNVGLSTGVGTITQTGGTVNVATISGFQSNVFGAVILGVDGAGTYTLNGGTLNTPILARGNGTATFNLGGGTLNATANTLNLDLPINLTGTGAGKGTVNSNGNDLSFTSAISGSGGFVKAGAGTISLLGTTNSYAGGTDITGGRVVSAGTGLGSGPVSLAAGSTLEVQGVQQGLLARFYTANLTSVTPGNTGSNVAMLTEFTSLDNLTSFLAGKAVVASESTTARGKTSVDYLDLGSANGNTALPPAILALGNGSNPFLAQLTGKFNATTTGEYTFQSRSDDGSMVFIDGQIAVDNNRSQGQTARTGTVNLSAGLHDITVAYYQGTGGGGFSVGVTQPGQGQSYTIAGGELNLSNTLLSYGSSALNIGALSGAAGSALAIGSGTLTTTFDTTTSTFAGAVSGTASGTLAKAGTGTLVLSGDSSASFTGATIVTAGALRVSGSIAGSTALNVNAGATLTLASTGDELGNNAPVTLSGGASTLARLTADNSTFAINETMGSLSLSGKAVLDLGTGVLGSTFNFADSSAATWATGATLSIYNYTGSVGSGAGLDKIFFGSSAGTLSSTQLAQISFYSDAGSTLMGGGALLGTGQLVPVPEPTTWMLGGAMLGLLGLRQSRRIVRAARVRA